MLPPIERTRHKAKQQRGGNDDNPAWRAKGEPRGLVTNRHTAQESSSPYHSQGHQHHRVTMNKQLALLAAVKCSSLPSITHTFSALTITIPSAETPPRLGSGSNTSITWIAISVDGSNRRRYCERGRGSVCGSCTTHVDTGSLNDSMNEGKRLGDNTRWQPTQNFLHGDGVHPH